MNWKEYIISDPTVLFGKAVVKNTRIPVDLILEKLGHGYSIETLLEAYPNLSMDAVHACLLFAAENVKHEKIVAIA